MLVDIKNSIHTILYRCRKRMFRRQTIIHTDNNGMAFINHRPAPPRIIVRRTKREASTMKINHYRIATPLLHTRTQPPQRPANSTRNTRPPTHPTHPTLALAQAIRTAHLLLQGIIRLGPINPEPSLGVVVPRDVEAQRDRARLAADCARDFAAEVGFGWSRAGHFVEEHAQFHEEAPEDGLHVEYPSWPGFAGVVHRHPARARGSRRALVFFGAGVHFGGEEGGQLQGMDSMQCCLGRSRLSCVCNAVLHVKRNQTQNCPQKESSSFKSCVRKLRHVHSTRIGICLDNLEW